MSVYTQYDLFSSMRLEDAMSVFTQYELFTGVRLVTAGNLISAPVYFELAVSEDLVDLTGVEEMTLLSLTEGISAQFRWNVYFASGFNRANELAGGPFGLTTPLSANGSLRGSAYSTLANFQGASRFLVGCGNNSGALQESALCSARLLVKRIS